MSRTKPNDAFEVQLRHDFFVMGVEAYLRDLAQGPHGANRRTGLQRDVRRDLDARFQAGAAWAEKRYGTRTEIEAAADIGIEGTGA